MDALGLIETTSLAGAMEASTAASQAAAASVSSVTLIDASFVVVKIEGDMPAVRAAVEAGAHAAQQSGSLICARIIPHREGPGKTVVTRKRSTPIVSAAPSPKKVTASPKPRRERAAAPRPAPAQPVAPATVSRSTASGTMSMDQLEALPVSKLRQYARGLAGLPIQGRQISMANKQQLLEAIRKIS